MRNVHFVIPARAGSVGLHNKNEKLFGYTAETMKGDPRVIVSTNDPNVKILAEHYEFKVHTRPPRLSGKDISMKATIDDVIRENGIGSDDIVFILYLTYPERTADDILDALKFFRQSGCRSMLCKAPVKDHPYHCMVELPGFRGAQHNETQREYHTRQSMPPVFRMYHYMVAFIASELSSLSPNLFNDDTVYYPLEERPLDIDTQAEYDQFLAARACDRGDRDQPQRGDGCSPSTD